MTDHKNQSNAIVVSGPGYFAEIATALQAGPFSSVQSVEVNGDLSLTDGNTTIVIGPGISRDSQVDSIFRAHELKRDVLLNVPEFKHLNSAVSTDIGGIRFIRIRGEKMGRAALLMQRVLDVALATLALIVVFLPALLIVGPIIVLTSRGGVFFSTTIVGKHGQRFTWRKFRSMRPARPGEDESRRQIVAEAIRASTAESVSGSTKVVDNDRVTKIGKVMRKTSLDELPQLLNVISGSMALVGPRPCLPFEYDEYNKWQRHRLDFKPGITGVWQVYGRSRVQFDEMVFMDICGQLNRSLLNDLKLIALTVPVAIFGRGAE